MSLAAFLGKPRPPAQAEPFRKTKAVHALTSSASNEAYTPPDVLEAARASLGGVIDLDPASCKVANEEVRATYIYTAKSAASIDGGTLLDRGQPRGGLFLPWGFAHPEPITVWLNPPGGFVNRETLLPAKRGMSSACAWWRKQLDEYRAGRVKAACFYTFRLDVLQNIQALEGYEPPHAFPFCIMKARPRHWHNGQWKDQGAGKPPKWEPPILKPDRGKSGQPTHACAVFFLPDGVAGTTRRLESEELFRDSFAPLGFVR